MKVSNSTEFRPIFETLEARECFSATPFAGFMGGVSVGAGDVNSPPGGVNVLMGDGSVRFIRDSIPPTAAYTGGVYVAAGYMTNNSD